MKLITIALLVLLQASSIGFRFYNQLDNRKFLPVSTAKPEWIKETEEHHNYSIPKIWMDSNYLAMWLDKNKDSICDDVVLFEIVEHRNNTVGPLVRYENHFPCDTMDKNLNKQILEYGFTK